MGSPTEFRFIKAWLYTIFLRMKVSQTFSLVDTNACIVSKTFEKFEKMVRLPQSELTNKAFWGV